MRVVKTRCAMVLNVIQYPGSGFAEIARSINSGDYLNQMTELAEYCWTRVSISSGLSAVRAEHVACKN
jgi:hypothetical protein